MSQLLERTGIKAERRWELSDRVCKVCAGKIRKTYEGFTFLSSCISVHNPAISTALDFVDGAKQLDVRTKRMLPTSVSTPERSPGLRKIQKYAEQDKENLSTSNTGVRAKKSLFARNCSDTETTISCEVPSTAPLLSVAIGINAGEENTPQTEDGENSTSITVFPASSKVLSKDDENLFLPMNIPLLHVLQSGKHRDQTDQENDIHRDEHFLNIDDVLCTKRTRVKILILSPNGDVKVKIPPVEEIDSILLLKNIALQKWKAVANAVFRHAELRDEILNALWRVLNAEFKAYSSSDCILNGRSPEQLIAFSNALFLKEIIVNCPFWNSCIRVPSRLPRQKPETPNFCRNPWVTRPPRLAHQVNNLWPHFVLSLTVYQTSASPKILLKQI